MTVWVRLPSCRSWCFVEHVDDASCTTSCRGRFEPQSVDFDLSLDPPAEERCKACAKAVDAAVKFDAVMPDDRFDGGDL